MVTARKTTKNSRTKADLEAELKDLRSQLNSQPAIDPKARELRFNNETAVRKAVEGVSVDKVVDTIGKTSLEVSRSLAQISEQLTQKVQELETTNQAIEIAKTELEELHGKEVVASSTASMLAEFDQKEKELAESATARRLEWIKEEQAHALSSKERDAEVLKNRTRESTEFEYAKQQERRRMQDSFNEQIRQQDLSNKLKQEELERGWSTREASLLAQEDRLKSLSAQVEAFPEEMKKASAREVGIVSSVMKRDHEHMLALLKKDSDSANALLRQENAALAASNKSSLDRIVQLEQQLVEAKKQVADIATKALDSASGAFALDRVSALSAPRNGEGQQRGKA